MKNSSYEVEIAARRRKRSLFDFGPNAWFVISRVSFIISPLPKAPNSWNCPPSGSSLLNVSFPGSETKLRSRVFLSRQRSLARSGTSFDRIPAHPPGRHRQPPTVAGCVLLNNSTRLQRVISTTLASHMQPFLTAGQRFTPAPLHSATASFSNSGTPRVLHKC